MKIKFLTTGGTIDKIYFDAKSEYEVGEPQIDTMLREAHVTVDYEVRQLMRKDSLELTDEDRQLIRRAIVEDSGRLFVVTHGTDTMTETARALAGIEDRTIVLTGALSPARFRGSDASFNIAMALAACQVMPSGVYIAMNGRIFEGDRVRKNVEYNRFEFIERREQE
jgi:L-asparaginase